MTGRFAAGRTPPRGWLATDSGSATVLLLAAMSVVAMVTAAALAVATVAAHRQRSATAADLTALAAASAPSGADIDGCRRALSVAAANGGRLVGCHAEAGAIEVTVAVELPGLLEPFGPVSVRSRAGPWPPSPRPDPLD